MKPEIAGSDGHDRTIESRMATVIPAGWKWGKQRPNSRPRAQRISRPELNEITRCLNMPYNIAAGNSSGYNYACGRLDHQTYYKVHSRQAEERLLGIDVLDPLFTTWLEEAALIEGLFPALRKRRRYAHPSMVLGQHGTRDPVKEANAHRFGLKSNTTTWPPKTPGRQAGTRS